MQPEDSALCPADWATHHHPHLNSVWLLWGEKGEECLPSVPVGHGHGRGHCRPFTRGRLSLVEAGFYARGIDAKVGRKGQNIGGKEEENAW